MKMTKDFQRYMKIIRNTHHDLLKVKNWPTILIKKRGKKKKGLLCNK